LKARTAVGKSAIRTKKIANGNLLKGKGERKGKKRVTGGGHQEGWGKKLAAKSKIQATNRNIEGSIGGPDGEKVSKGENRS